MSKTLECFWKKPIMKQIEKAGSIENQSLQVRECYHCDGYMSICDRYLEKSKSRFNWLGLKEDYTR